MQRAARSALRLAKWAAARKTAAAKAEDFKTAKNLEEVVAVQERQLKEMACLTKEVCRATEELDQQQDRVVEGVAV